MKTFSILLIAALLAACAAQPVYRQAGAPAHESQPVEIERYLGLWHEQARLPNQFERGCVRATAEYGLRPDGLISVLNTCFETDGAQREARGRARVVGEGRLKVSFFGPFWGDYWVLDRAEDYAWSIVGEPEGRYLWLLTRDRTLTHGQRAQFEARIAALGYSPADLYWAPQPNAP